MQSECFKSVRKACARHVDTYQCRNQQRPCSCLELPASLPLESLFSLYHRPRPCIMLKTLSNPCIRVGQGTEDAPDEVVTKNNVISEGYQVETWGIKRR